MDKNDQGVPSLHEILEKCGNMSSVPMAKNYLLMMAKKFLSAGKPMNAVCCLTEALNQGVLKRYGGFKVAPEERVGLDDLCRNIEDLVKVHPPDPMSDDEHLSDLVNRVERLPDEWTVLQITKQYYSKAFMSKFEDIVTKDTGYHLILLKYPRMELNKNRPILLTVAPSGTDVYQRLLNVLTSLKDDLKYNKENDTTEARRQYWSRAKQNSEDLGRCLTDMRDFFAPWLFLFAGKFTDSASEAHEQQVFGKVDEFCRLHKRSTEDRVLLSLACRRIDLMEAPGIARLAAHLDSDPSKAALIAAFLENLKTGMSRDSFEFPYPCLVIIDELLDFVFWEMLNVDQGLCRLSSLEVLCGLTESHGGSIRNGYLQVEAGTSGQVVINPENDLPGMESRIVEFVSQVLPESFKRTVGEAPTRENLQEILTKQRVFLYFGHGSGLQFVRGDFLVSHTIRAVTFLFGCGSVQLNSMGMWAEMKGAHIYYHVARCPAVIGMLLVVTDYHADVTASIILSRWMRGGSEAWKKATKEHWKSVYKNQQELETLMAKRFDFEPNLLRVLSDLRRDSRDVFTLRQVVAPCLRGLPVMSV